jgi:hypothetical protein
VNEEERHPQLPTSLPNGVDGVENVSTLGQIAKKTAKDCAVRSSQRICIWVKRKVMKGRKHNWKSERKVENGHSFRSFTLTILAHQSFRGNVHFHKDTNENVL